MDAEGKRPEWEALNSEMTDDVENYLGYIKDGDEAKRDAYVSKMDASKQESIKQGLEQQKRDYQRFPDGYEDAPDKKLAQEQLNLLGKIKELEQKSELWEKTKEKATKMLWWDDVAKGLAKQKQQTQQSDATTENSKTSSPSTKQTETSSTPDTLSQNGKVWFMHPIAIQMFKRCYCNRDFDVNDIEMIVKQLRQSAGLNTLELFSKKNCKLDNKDKTYQRFTEELNQMMKKYNINTCIRKIHFIAQSFVESDKFQTLKEYGESFSYDPWRGRGIIQLTHAGNKNGTIGYKQYFNFLGKFDFEKDYEVLNSDLHIAIDVGGYFWTRGKLLDKGEYLKSSTKLNGEWQYYKKTKMAIYTTIDINIVADRDHVEQVTYLVNGGYNHLNERIKYTNKLKEIFDYDECINKI
ncbi:hypothetical protein J3U21_10180 [Gilliamella sp. B2776]|uniref:hypothetical protein n=1 Tax=unclassified Gilliamella TaxID=2685620 RepID=UPI002269C99D|nr:MULTISPECIES: hypothetical protein [unclassified Gilliamella]MCX8650616.1 hypothetical protein [Gilliamella sp. B2779]MCX8692519.1 hypothetical protein [Gilliamella sp. B2776]